MSPIHADVHSVPRGVDARTRAETPLLMLKFALHAVSDVHPIEHGERRSEKPRDCPINSRWRVWLRIQLDIERGSDSRIHN